MKVKIRRIRLVNPAPLGLTAVVEHHLGPETKLDNGQIELSFDKDPRFVRVAFVGKGYFELIPLSNVAGIMLDPADE